MRSRSTSPSHGASRLNTQPPPIQTQSNRTGRTSTDTQLTRPDDDTVEHEPSTPTPADSTHLASRVCLGDLTLQVPVGLVMLTTTALTPVEQQTLQTLESRMRPIPLLCIEVRNVRGLSSLQPHLERLLCATTPTIVLTKGTMDTTAHAVCGWLRQLTLEGAEDIPSATGYPTRPDIFNGSHGFQLVHFEPYLDRIRVHWPQNVQQGDDAYWCRLKDWAADAENGSAPDAVNRVMNDLVSWMQSTNSNVASLHDLSLDLGGIGLLPPLPPRNIRHLTLLGCGVTELHPLPMSVTRLTLAGNGLHSLQIDPTSLPMLQVLNLEGNQLSELPTCLWALPPTVKVYLAENPLSDETLQKLQRARERPWGPRFVWPAGLGYQAHASVLEPLSSGASTPEAYTTDGEEECAEPFATPTAPRMPRSVLGAANRFEDSREVFADSAHATPPARLGDALGALLDSDDLLDDDSVEDLLGTPAFIAWVQRLSALPYKQRERFAAGMVDLIDLCTSDEELRELVLAVVEDASETCDDRVTLTWERVRLLVRCQGVLREGVEENLDKVIALARQAMRQETVSNISQRHTRQAGLRRDAAPANDRGHTAEVEEIEIHLAYLSQAAGPLGIEMEAGFGRFIQSAISGVTLRDVSRAIKAAQQEENLHFPDFLTQWSPWLQVLRQLALTSMQTLDEECADLDRMNTWHVEAMRAAHEAGLSGKELENAVTKALALRGREFRTERLRELTLAVLAERGQRGLLAPVWTTQ